jgi:hypothetical protein
MGTSLVNKSYEGINYPIAASPDNTMRKKLNNIATSPGDTMKG